ncbi:hypothetical protein SHJG_3814 [Streptomyces hygroscopicus subsp. jinggangensis 5008]|nr:hypothetical protein SHJG_3814 [Streptomyces hygroscopicus subsp. jinggangensis 5008]AGF63244.1 hypothetical protein SHJGH_3579 [Streptomyces hygroscopicus subsp. jinggangensis TL01]
MPYSSGGNTASPLPSGVITIASTGQFSAAARICPAASVSGCAGWD